MRFVFDASHASETQHSSESLSGGLALVYRSQLANFTHLKHHDFSYVAAFTTKRGKQRAYCLDGITE